MLKKMFQDMKDKKILWPTVALLSICLINFFSIPNFFNIVVKDGHLFGSVIDILNRSSVLVIMSIGMTLVIATGGIDISVGAVAAISGAVACTLIAAGQSLFVAVTAALLVCMVCGIWNGLLVAKLGIQCMVGTLILMIVGRGIAMLITDGQIVTVTSESYSYLANGFLFGLPFSLYITAFVTITILFFVRKTAYGLFLEAAGTNPNATKFAGINATNIIFIAYVISGVTAGISGLLISSNIKAADSNNAGHWKELDAILATVIGGTSMMGGRAYIGGTIIGALFIQSITTTIYAMGVPPEITLIVKAFVIIVVTLLQSDQFRMMFSKQYKRERLTT